MQDQRTVDRAGLILFLEALEAYERRVREHQRAIERDPLKIGTALEHQRWVEVGEAKDRLKDSAIRWKFHSWDGGAK